MLAKTSKDSAVMVSVVIVQIFHERENKVRPFTEKKKKKRSLGVENGIQYCEWLQYSWLENPMDRGA